MAKFETGTGTERDLAIFINCVQERAIIFDEMMTNPPPITAAGLSEQDANRIADLMTKEKP